MSNKAYVYPQKTLFEKRSKIKMPHQLKTTFNHGDFNLFKVYEVYPGDTFSLDVASLIRMSTPIAPIMDNITMHLAAYFIPSRLVFDNWEQLMGANKTGAWTQDDNAYSAPAFEMDTVGPLTVDYNSYLAQSGLPRGMDWACYVNLLPFRGLALVWNEFYRNQNVTAPLAIDHSAANKVLVSDTDGTPSSFVIGSTLLKLGKYSDPFTKCLPEPQKHDPVSFIPEDIEVGLYPANTSTLGNNVSVGIPSGTSVTKDEFIQMGLIATNTGVGDKYLYAQVDEAWNNINALRFAFQLQKFYEKDARYGSRSVSKVPTINRGKKLEGLFNRLIRGEGFLASRNAYAM